MQHKNFLSNISWLMGGKIINMLLQFAVSLATARYLGPENFGIINYVAAYVSFFSSITSLGLSIIIIKEVSSGDKDQNTVIWTGIFLRFLTSILSTLSVLCLIYITHPGDKLILVIALLQSISIIFSSFDTIAYWFQAKLLAKYTSIAGILAYICMSIYRVYLLSINADIVYFALATSVDMIFLTFFLMIFYVKRMGLRPKLSCKVGRYLLKQSYHYMIAGLITIIYSQMDRVMLGKMINNEAVGLYSATLTISSLWSLISSALIQSFTPILFDASKSDKQKFLFRLKQSYSLIFWLNAIYCIFVTIFSEYIVLLLYGKDYVSAHSTLIVVVWYYGISVTSTLTQIYLSSEGKNKYITQFCAVGVVVNFMLNFILIPIFGIIGAAVATLITQIVIQMIMPLVIKETREIGLVMWKAMNPKNVITKDTIKIIKTRFYKHQS